MSTTHMIFDLDMMIYATAMLVWVNRLDKENERPKERVRALEKLLVL